MDPQPSESVTPAVKGEDFVHIGDPSVVNLSESMVRIDQPIDASVSPFLDTADSNQRKLLPDELSRNVVFLTCESTADSGVCDVYLIGTAHISRESCGEVQEIINFLKPQAVFLELCPSRLTVLAPQNLKVPTVREMIAMLRKKQNIFGVLYSWFLAKIADKLDVFPGAEFRVAYEEAIKYDGRVILGDRPVQLNEMDDNDVLTLVIQEIGKAFPTLMETLVHERDQYMSSTLLEVARECNSVVAVVGKGHLQGIKKHWKQPIMVKDLLTDPSPKPAVSAVWIITSVGVAVAGLAIVSGIYLSCKK